MPPPCPPPCPIPGPHPLPPPCPHSHGKIFQGCIAYINAYIDVRVRQLYQLLKGIIQKISSQYCGPWNYIILRDSKDGSLHRVQVIDGILHSEPISEDQLNESGTDEVTTP